jgi:hypothetical protein
MAPRFKLLRLYGRRMGLMKIDKVWGKSVFVQMRITTPSRGVCQEGPKVLVRQALEKAGAIQVRYE